MKAQLDGGQLGSPVMISGRVKWYRPPEYYSGSRWRGTPALDGGGALMNQAIHTLDLMQWMFGPVTRVYGAAATRLHRIDVEDTLTAVLEFESGALGTIEAATSVYPGYQRRLEMTGTEGTVTLEHDRSSGVDLRSRTLEREPPDCIDRHDRQRLVPDRVRRERSRARHRGLRRGDRAKTGVRRVTAGKGVAAWKSSKPSTPRQSPIRRWRREAPTGSGPRGRQGGALPPRAKRGRQLAQPRHLLGSHVGQWWTNGPASETEQDP